MVNDQKKDLSLLPYPERGVSTLYSLFTFHEASLGMSWLQLFSTQFLDSSPSLALEEART